MPKKKKTHNARHMNWIDFGSTSSLSDKIDPILLLLPEPVMLAITMEVRLGHLEGVVGQSSCAILYFFWNVAQLLLADLPLVSHNTVPT